MKIRSSSKLTARPDRLLACSQDSLVEQARKAGPRGDGNWLEYDEVWRRLQYGAHQMAKAKHVHLSDDHIETMADLGSGHEERMKGRLHWLMGYGWLAGYWGD